MTSTSSLQRFIKSEVSVGIRKDKVESKEYEVMADKDASMQVLVENAKKRMEGWHSPDTKCEWLTTEIRSISPEGGRLTQLFVLQSGESKGTIIADWDNKIVIAWDMYPAFGR